MLVFIAGDSTRSVIMPYTLLLTAFHSVLEMSISMGKIYSPPAAADCAKEDGGIPSYKLPLGSRGV